MAKRLCFLSTPDKAKLYYQRFIDFEWFSGFSKSQKQKCITSMHNSINKNFNGLKVLEISTKSLQPLGVKLSAFNLKFYDEIRNKEFPIENVFQSSKVFSSGGPYLDLLEVLPKDAKRDDRLKNSGMLKGFYYDDFMWELYPQTMFYDWLYMKSLARDKQLSQEILKYNAFTDIEFNHNHSINCQARAALFVSLSKKGILEDILNDKDKMKSIY